MGAVFLAEDNWRSGRRTAIKCAPTSDPALRNALVREFECLRLLRHPHVVEVRDFGTCSVAAQVYYTMEHVDGVPLDRAVEGVPVEETVRLVGQACQALAFVHQKKSGSGDLALAYGHLWRHAAHIIGVDNPDGLLEHVRTQSSTRYLHETRILLDAWIYYKRFAVSLLGVQPGEESALLEALP